MTGRVVGRGTGPSGGWRAWELRGAKEATVFTPKEKQMLSSIRPNSAYHVTLL